MFRHNLQFTMADGTDTCNDHVRPAVTRSKNRFVQEPKKYYQYCSYPYGTTTHMTFYEKYPMTIDQNVVKSLLFKTFCRRRYVLVTKINFLSLRLIRNRHKLFQCYIYDERCSIFLTILKRH